METIVMEYLITFDKKQDFCKNTESFCFLLQSIHGLVCNDTSILYKNIKIQFENKLLDTDDHNNRIFHTTFSIEKLEYLYIFEKFIKDVRVLFLNTAYNREVITLYNGISGYYCQKAYPYFYQIENLMRKLLTQFMFVNIGEHWDKTNLPDRLENVILRKKDNNSYDYLYQTDFIHLSQFLFNKNESKMKEDLFQRLKTDIGSLTQGELKKYLPKSNWEKYFEQIVSCEGEMLKKRWERLYELRCIVAHNKVFYNQDYEELKKIISEIRPILLEAIQKLDKVKIKAEEKETLNEELIANSNSKLAEFLKIYHIFFQCLEGICSQNDYEIKNRRNIFSILKENHIIAEESINKIHEIFQFRDQLVHKALLDGLSYADLDSYISFMQQMIHTFSADIPDTIIVPARIEGFEKVFKNENCWYEVRIAKAMRDKLKYICAYQVAPISAITHIACIASIEEFKNSDKCIIYFKDKARPLEKRIQLTDAKNAIQSIRYTNYNRLIVSNTIEELFLKKQDSI